MFDLICDLSDGPEKELLMFTFTSNLANCSKLVPPIISRGDMAQGAWMTGFYIGKTYLENNVFHYFENRLTKTVKGKECYLQLRKEKNVQSTYKILNEDAKKLSLKDDSIDFVTLEQILNSGRIPRLAINNFRKTLKLDEIQQDVCVNPIKISFK